MNGGEVRWHDKTFMRIKANAGTKIKIIRRRLRAVVQIDDDPFEPYRKVKTYKSKFTMVYRSYGQLPTDEDSTVRH
jgi:hypothetical protein